MGPAEFPFGEAFLDSIDPERSFKKRSFRVDPTSCLLLNRRSPYAPLRNAVGRDGDRNAAEEERRVEDQEPQGSMAHDQIEVLT
jgi:hypothetical protein